MNDELTARAPRERSPSFPVVSLKVAVERLKDFDNKFGRHPARYPRAGLAWGMEEGSSQANRYLAALKSFGLVEYKGSGTNRTVEVSEAGRRYLLAQQPSIKEEIIRSAALKPKAIAKFWPSWQADRPPDEVCLDELRLTHGFTKASAPQFLKVYDETISFAGLTSHDKVGVVEDDDDEDEPHEETDVTEVPPSFSATGALASAVRTPSPPTSFDEGWEEERLIDDDGDVIYILYRGKPSRDRYEYIRDYLDFKIARMKRQSSTE